MIVTKFTHSCLLVQTAGRNALFDPGMYSTFEIDELPELHDIFITHAHPDHMDLERIRQLRARFPQARITAPADAAAILASGGMAGAQTTPPDGVRLFDAPHESIRPFADVDAPQEYGYHYLGALSNPGDSHSFSESMPVLALPVQGPWGSVVGAMQAAMALRLRYVIPVHDWHWNAAARQQLYQRMQARFGEQGVIFVDITDGKPVTIDA
ncbi:MAG TPA: MBL fold metallo-hydrolase [Candidatus Saccharimonadales bacterium]|nr:MBL fold metallo-hydrolase [Candidatus Saccharimonadales bacterium]